MSYCVYLLEDCNGNGYIGSTRYFKRRLAEHKNNTHNYCKSNLLAKPFNHLVLEEYEDEDNMLVGEQFYIKLYKSLYGDKLLNKAIPLRTKKEYNYENKDVILEYHKIYRETHKDKIKLIYTKYNDGHKQYRKNYYIENIDKIKEYRSQIIECECGSTIQLPEKARHLKSKKHQDFLNSQSS